MIISRIIGILLAIVGLVSATIYTWVGLDNWLSDQGILDSIVACSISLFMMFVGGILLGALGKKVGSNMVSLGLAGTFVLALFSYLTLTGVEDMGVEHIGEFLMGFVLAVLSMIPLAITIMGLGILSGVFITVITKKIGGKVAPQLRSESDDEL